MLSRGLLLVPLIFLAALWLGIKTPPFQSPDEFDHIERAYLLSKGQFLLAAPDGQASGGPVDTGLLEYMSYFDGLPHEPNIKISSEELAAAAEVEWSGARQYETLPGTGYYFPLIYAPQAVGLAMGEMLGLTVDGAYRLARLLTLATGALLLLMAFRIKAPSALILALFLLPMTLFQAASASIDFVATACLLLVSALFIKTMADPQRPGIGRLLVFSVLVFIIAGCRLHMAPLILLIFALGLRFRDWRAFGLSLVLTVLIAGWYGFAISRTVDLRVEIGTPTFEILRYYLSNPEQLLNVLWATVTNVKITSYYLRSFLGILGWLDIQFAPQFYSMLWVMVLATLVFSILRVGVQKDPLIAVTLISSALLGGLLVFFSLLLAWTPHPATVVMGVQGRYFLLPVLLLAGLISTSDGSVKGSAGLAVIENTVLFLLFGLSVFATTNALQLRYFLTGTP